MWKIKRSILVSNPECIMKQNFSVTHYFGIPDTVPIEIGANFKIIFLFFDITASFSELCDTLYNNVCPQH